MSDHISPYRCRDRSTDGQWGASCIRGLAFGVMFGCAAWGTLPVHAQTGLLNDTGQSSCYNTSHTAVPCDGATAGNAGTQPHQDGRYGRDAAGVTKTGGGAAGFDFSCVLWNGTVINGPNCTTGLTANTTDTASPTPATDWACTKDNVTGLVWSLQTQGPLTWNTATGVGYSDAGHNTPGRCGYNTGWRLPTWYELLSIVHRGLSVGPMVDASYFPSTQNSEYWTVHEYSFVTTQARTVAFSVGNTQTRIKNSNYYVRLVRSGP